MTATATIKPKSKSELFADYLKSNLSKQAYDSLHLELGYGTTNRLTRLLRPDSNNLGQFTASEVSTLSALLSEKSETPITPQDLIVEWGLGVEVITIDEANRLVQYQGLELGFQIAA
jgi:hypothetical protein